MEETREASLLFGQRRRRTGFSISEIKNSEPTEKREIPEISAQIQI
jgi:hypothetical protein